MYLDGGSDSHNMLVPYDGCNGGKSKCIEVSLSMNIFR